ncbi:hypothetical protein [Alteromonas sp. A079]|uniref:hypothetical protein n=1 Tax=Alteromonas sp. A079 TaxID=3410268 RepID=UPI003B9E0585
MEDNTVDIGNQQLKMLLQETDVAFQALMQHPEAAELSDAYDRAKAALDAYTASMKQAVSQRQQYNRQR